MPYKQQAVKNQSIICQIKEWKGAIAQPGLSEYSFGAAGEEIFLRPSDHKPLVERRAQHAARE